MANRVLLDYLADKDKEANKVSTDEDWEDLRRAVSGATFGYSEKALRSIEPELPPLPEIESLLSPEFAIEAVGGIAGPGKVLGLANKALMGAKALAPAVKAAPRLTQLGVSTGESALEGGLHAAGHDEDVGTGALTSGLFGAGLMAPIAGVGGIAEHVIKKGVPFTPFQGLPPKGAAQFADPFDPPDFIDDPRMNQGLVDWFAKEGIEIPAEVARHQDPMVRFLMMKAAQMSHAIPHLQAQGNRINKQFRASIHRIPDMLPTNMASVSNIDAGEHTAKIFKDTIEDYRIAATQKYDELFKLGDLGEQFVNGPELARQLRTLLDAEGYLKASVPGGVTKVKNLIKRLNPKEKKSKVAKASPDPTIPAPATAPQPTPVPPKSRVAPKPTVPIVYKDVWAEIQKWWPSGQWDKGDFVAVKAQQKVKEFLRGIAERHSPGYATALASADQFWSKAHKEVETETGKIIMSTKPSKLVEKLTETIESIRAVREDMGDVMVTKLAQAKIHNIIWDATNKETKEISSGSFSAALHKHGGKDSGIRGGYMEELFRDHPEVLDHIEETQRALTMAEGPLNKYSGLYEGIGGGKERLAITTAAQSPNRTIGLLTHFTLGKHLGKEITRPPETGMLFGGSSPYVPGLPTHIADEIRRAEAVTGTLQRGMTYGQPVE
jgi:hypothetical protein